MSCEPSFGKFIQKLALGPKSEARTSRLCIGVIFPTVYLGVKNTSVESQPLLKFSWEKQTYTEYKVIIQFYRTNVCTIFLWELREYGKRIKLVQHTSFNREEVLTLSNQKKKYKILVAVTILTTKHLHPPVVTYHIGIRSNENSSPRTSNLIFLE